MTSLLSAPAEDCLLLVHRMHERRETATTSGLARELGVTDSTVTAMVQKLAKSKLLKHTPRKEITLTSQGGAVARKLIRRHRLIESYLQQRLGYSWDEVHAEAEKIEHAVSDKFVEAIARELGFPKFDPHGDPIPGNDGGDESRELIALSQMREREAGTVARILGGKPEELTYLSNLGLVLGAEILIQSRPADDAIVQLVCGKKQIVVGLKLASQILIEQNIS